MKKTQEKRRIKSAKAKKQKQCTEEDWIIVITIIIMKNDKAVRKRATQCTLEVSKIKYKHNMWMLFIL